MQAYNGKYIKDIVSIYEEEYEDLKKNQQENTAYKSLISKIKTDNPHLVKAYNYHNLFLLLAFISCLLCIIISFFNIMIITHCPGDSDSPCTITNGSPVLTIYSLGYDFCILLPLVIFLIMSIVEFFKPQKAISIINIIVSLIPAALMPYLGWLYSFYLFPYIVLIVLTILNFIFSSLVLFESINASKQEKG